MEEQEEEEEEEEAPMGRLRVEDDIVGYGTEHPPVSHTCPSTFRKENRTGCMKNLPEVQCYPWLTRTQWQWIACIQFHAH